MTAEVDAAKRAVHPYAAMFPMLPADELRALADDIAANGQLHPITLWVDPATGEEFLLDGRNRLAACELAGVEPKTEHHHGDPYAFVVSANTHRRNLNAGQVAMARAVALVEQGQRANGRWKRGSLTNVSDSSYNMAWAGFILDNDRAAAALVFGGESLANVHEAVKATVEARAEQQKQADELLKEAPDLARQITEDGIAHETAWRMYRQRVDADDARDRERREQDIKRWRGTAEAVRSISSITGPWMDDYDPDLIGVLDNYLSTDRLLAARDQIDNLIDWSKQQ